MKSPVVRLKLRVRLPNGTRAYLDPVHTANRKLRPLHAYYNGLPVHFSDGVYHLRYLKGDRRVWEAACELRRTLDQVRASTRAIEKTLQQQRQVLNDAHKHISGVTKALQKPAPKTP